MLIATLLVTVDETELDTAVETITVPVDAGIVTVFVPATAGTFTVTLPLVSPVRTKAPIIYPLLLYILLCFMSKAQPIFVLMVS